MEYVLFVVNVSTACSQVEKIDSQLQPVIVVLIGHLNCTNGVTCYVGPKLQKFQYVCIVDLEDCRT